MLYEIDNKPMYLHTVDKLIDLKKSNENVDEIIFVTKYDKIIDNLKNKDIKVVKNNNSEFGISQSIKLGFQIHLIIHICLLNPTIFTSKYKQKLLNLSGDKGGKKIILENLNDLFTFKILSEKEVIDIDFKYQL